MNKYNSLARGAIPPEPASAEPLPLFRHEVMDARGSQWFGAISLAQAASSWMIATVAALLACGAMAFAGFGSFTKKVRVAGVTVPSGGSVTIKAPVAGIIARSLAVEGQAVDAGQPLFELSTERQGSSGEISALVSSQLAIRQQALLTELHLRQTQSGERRRVIGERLGNLRAEAIELEHETSLAQHRKRLAQTSVAQYETLQRGGFVSQAQIQQKQEELLDAETRLSTLARSRVQLQANRINLEAEQTALASALATEVNQLHSAQASLQQEVVENQNRKTNVIVAPQAGQVTTITYQQGQAVTAGQELATLIPHARQRASGDALEAHLYAPSRSVGFVAVGQIVQVRYQAFPYQKFGLQTGTVVDVSATPFAPGELPANLASTILSNAQQNTLGFNGNEAMYRIRVKLTKQTIDAYGRPVALKPGMTLEADVVQERRKIWEWIAEPLLAATRR